jgi:hypothetical protein
MRDRFGNEAARGMLDKAVMALEEKADELDESSWNSSLHIGT